MNQSELKADTLSSAETSYTRTLGKNAWRLERGKIKARASFPALPFSLSSAPAPVFFFHWCLLTGAFAEEREAQRGKTRARKSRLV